MSPKTKKIFRGLFYLKTCWNQAIGNLTMPIQVWNNLLMISIAFKVFNLIDYLYVVVPATLFIIGLVLWVGHLILSRGLLEIEVSLQNEYNPELQKILRNAVKEEMEKHEHCA